MKGNRHYEDAKYTLGLVESYDQQAIAEATLALAYEQRTANLLALMHHAAGFTHGGGYGELYAEVAKRLGLEGN